METISEESAEECTEEDSKEDKSEDKNQRYYVATIQYEFKSSETVFFSTSFPYSLSEVYDSIREYKSEFLPTGTFEIVHTRELLTRSLLGRRVELLLSDKCQDLKRNWRISFPRSILKRS